MQVPAETPAGVHKLTASTGSRGDTIDLRVTQAGGESATLMVTASNFGDVGCPMRELYVHTVGSSPPVASVRACLLKRLIAPSALVRLEYVTVLERLVAERLEASDCILMARPHKDLIDMDVPRSGMLMSVVQAWQHASTIAS